MLRGKLYPGHPQHWVPLAFDLSRLIHWFLDAALIASTGYRRQLAEIGLTVLFLAGPARLAAPTPTAVSRASARGSSATCSAPTAGSGGCRGARPAMYEFGKSNAAGINLRTFCLLQ